MFKIKMRVTGGTKYWTLNNQISFVTELTWVVSVSVLLWFSPQAHHTSKQFLWTLSWQIHIWYIAYPQLRYPALGVLETAVRIVPTSKAWNDSKIRSTAWGSFASAQFSSIVIHSFCYHLGIYQFGLQKNIFLKIQVSLWCGLPYTNCNETQLNPCSWLQLTTTFRTGERNTSF